MADNEDGTLRLREWAPGVDTLCQAREAPGDCSGKSLEDTSRSQGQQRHYDSWCCILWKGARVGGRKAVTEPGC